MSQLLHSLESWPRFSGIDSFTTVMSRSPLYIEDQEMPAPGRPLRILARIIVTCITLPVFLAMGTVYNGTVAASQLFLGSVSLVARDCYRLKHSDHYFDKGFYHLCASIFDYSIFFAFPLVAITYSAFPNQLNRTYAGLNKWMYRSITGHNF